MWKDMFNNVLFFLLITKVYFSQQNVSIWLFVFLMIETIKTMSI